jgi:hypothetical protein
LPLAILNEDDLLPVLKRFGRVSGWARQQLVKLSAADLVTTEYFITLDPDVILCKPVTANDIFVGGKAILESVPRAGLPPNEAAWWAGSAAMLGTTYDPEQPGMRVTPAILSRTVCRRLHDDLRQRHRCDWSVALLRGADSGWTEYTLYYLTAERHGLLGTFHTVPERGQARLFCASNVWYREDFDTWDVAACFGSEDLGLFTVVQSSSRISAAQIRDRLAGRLPLHGNRDLGPNLPLRLRSLGEDILRKTIGFT